MIPFKVGARVKCIEPRSGYLELGRIYKIEYIDREGLIKLEGVGDSNTTWYTRRFEIAKQDYTYKQLLEKLK